MILNNLHLFNSFFSRSPFGSLEGEGQGRSALCNSSSHNTQLQYYSEFKKIAFECLQTNRGNGYQNRLWLANVEDD